MCRHLAWLGEPVSLSSLVLEPANSLLVQSYAPRMQSHGTVNADGWGVAFHPDATTPPARWRSDRPLWSDVSFASVSPTIRAPSVVAAVRSATAGMPADASAAAPFVSGRWALSHNGIVDRSVLALSPHAESTCDSAVLAAAIFAAGAEGLGRTVAEVGARDPGARLNVLAGNGERLLATTWGDTLFLRRTGAGTTLASEPFGDDSQWSPVPDRHLVDVRLDQTRITPLDLN